MHVCVCSLVKLFKDASSGGSSSSSECRFYGSIISVLHYSLYLSSLVLFFLSACPSIPPSPHHSCHYISWQQPDLEEIKNLCCFVALPRGWADVNKVVHYGLPHAHARKHTVLKIKCIRTLLPAIHLLRVTSEHTDSKPNKDAVYSLTRGSLGGVCASYHLSCIDGALNIIKTNIDALFVLIYVPVAEPVTGKASS